jgi:hypothetical protein
MLNSSLFNCKNKDTYPPFKNGLYLEEYVFNEMKKRNNCFTTTRKYIPVVWTNFQIEGWFQSKKHEMQLLLNEWVCQNPSESGYFTLVQYDDGPLLSLPPNTTIYGACSGDIPIPLIYQDVTNTLRNIQQKSFSEKSILCSFVGSITSNHIKPNVRETIFNVLNNNKSFLLYKTNGWTPNVSIVSQRNFVSVTIDSKFALAPRGYGRGSFRFYECLLLGTIPVYVWNDIEWLPFKNVIDYSKLCVSINISDIDKLETILNLITSEQYNEMIEYYKSIKHLFELDGMMNQIILENLF